MAIHIDREDFLRGAGVPRNLTPEFIGQFYIDTTHKIPYINIDGSAAGWVPLSKGDHVHGASDFSDLDEFIADVLNQEYLTTAMQTLRSGGNHWLGLNNFSNLQKDGSPVLSESSKLEDFSNVLFDPTKVQPGQVLGWTGSGWGLYNPDGKLATGGTTDFTNFITKGDIINSYTSTSPTKVMAASAGLALKGYVDDNFAKEDHTHTEYAPTNHTHTGYVRTSGAIETISGSKIISSNFSFTDQTGNKKPIEFTSTTGGILSLNTPSSSSDPFKFEIGGSPSKKKNLYFGGASGSSGEELVLNFEKVIIPSGKIVTTEDTGRLVFSPIRIQTTDESLEGTKYVNNMSSRDFGLNLGNTSLIGASQIVFSRAAQAPSEGILFPKSYAGNTQPTEIGYYNYMYILDDHIHTDATLSTTKNYIELGGRRIFFGPNSPGRESRSGDIWFKI